MHDAARIAAAIALLDEIFSTRRPADTVASAFFRTRRFIGSKDRGAVAERVYGVLRARARLTWHLRRRTFEPTARALVLAHAALVLGERADALERRFSQGPHGPGPLKEGERRLLAALDGRRLDDDTMPEAVRLEVPDWAEGPLRAALGERFAEECAALREAAPVDLRANVLKAGREEAIAALAAEGLAAEPTPYSPWGMRLAARANLAATTTFKDGLVEVQDEGSQLAALMVGARPGQRVVDFCAGAGGKTLALAATMENRGAIVACDVLAGRLTRAKLRFRRAGAHNITTRAFSSARDPYVKRHARSFDRVLVDAPCSGTGTWRRNPDARWNALAPDLRELTALQSEILESAARLVKPGGRLVYVTCSLLKEENEARIAAFLAAAPDFRAVPASEAWAASAGGAFPGDDPYLRLSPARHGTDGFFVAVMEREAAAS
ncbi:MAG: RsmB/NOP family class I SAM-dependent RNA methyltransferase [Alphaproteobacteria bacterium]|nr:RsmB/NOP family class I SAM-dependent RNA methyltransferase [Alphaproteobacteria bacterium]